ncbi:ArsA-related P-loop ATPase [Baekduia sp. Peel2402]|uniref:ArsA-related P-loop ATPase n=1 Tax=Baekduia sp. Peel2402 TaxID=3458296 RepID=UPI00403EE784
MTRSDEIRLVVVTGKGGTGRTTVAAALALGAARRGRRAIVCEVSGQAQVPRLMARDGDGAATANGAPGAERRLADGLWATTIDAESALEEWMTRQVPRRLVSPVLRSGVFAGFVQAAPGARELVTITKAWELGEAHRWRRDARPFDVVILDAPASGHGLGMLRTPGTFARIARVGPIAGQARTVAEALVDPRRCRLVAVARPTGLAIGETLEYEAATTTALGRGLDAIVVNGMWPKRISREEARTVAALDGAVPAGTRHAVLSSYERVREQQGQLARLRRHAVAPISTLPFVFNDHLGPEQIRDFSARLSEPD